jgi:hypothetical protein
MRGTPYTPTEALEIVARSHSRLVDRGADHESAVRLIAHRFGLRIDVARRAVSMGRQRVRAASGVRAA